MPDYKPNQIVRALAVISLIAAFVLVIVVVATTGGGGSGSGNDGSAHKSHVSRAGQRAIRRGFWIVRSGDTLGAISIKTGIDVTTLQALNPDLDPQTLREGQRIALH